MPACIAWSNAGVCNRERSSRFARSECSANTPIVRELGKPQNQRAHPTCNRGKSVVVTCLMAILAENTIGARAFSRQALKKWGNVLWAFKAPTLNNVVNLNVLAEE